MYDPVETIFRATEYIESHLQSDVTVAQMAESAGYSLFHFVRTFNKIVQHTPYDYLTRRRLSEAAGVLATSERRIADIAQDFGFNNQESFSRAFKRMFEVQPSQWREKSASISAMRMPPKSLADLHFIYRKEFQYPNVEAFGDRTFHGLMTALVTDPRAQQEQRRRLFMDLCTIVAPDIPSRFAAITTCTDSGREKAYLFIGIESQEPFPAIQALVSRKLPAGRYVRISCSEAERSLALNYLYFTWFPGAGMRPAGQSEIEFFSPPEEATGRDLYIPVEILEKRPGAIQKDRS